MLESSGEPRRGAFFCESEGNRWGFQQPKDCPATPLPLQCSAQPAPQEVGVIACHRATDSCPCCSAFSSTPWEGSRAEDGSGPSAPASTQEIQRRLQSLDLVQPGSCHLGNKTAVEISLSFLCNLHFIFKKKKNQILASL